MKSLPLLFPKVYFGEHVHVESPSSIKIGDGSCIGEEVWLSTCFVESSISIGIRVLVGRRSVISASRQLEIGSFCVLSPNVYVSDTNHGYKDITKPIMGQGVVIGDEVVIEENCWLGINSVIMSSIGRGSVVGANSVVMEPPPPFSVVAGSPATTKKMYNPYSKLWEPVHTADDVKKAMEVRAKIGIPNRAEYYSILCLNSVEPIGSWAAGWHSWREK